MRGDSSQSALATVLRADVAARALLMLALALELLRMIASGRAGMRHFTDDAYYYAIVARNVAETGRATFDGVGLTSGFHPLLLGIEVLLLRMLGPDAPPSAQYAVLLAFVCGLFAATLGAVALWRRARLRDERERVLHACLLAVLALFATRDHARIFLMGMETVLTFPLWILAAAFVWRGRYAAAGVSAAALALARLDAAVFVVAPLAACVAFGARRAPRVAAARVAWLVGPTALAVGAYMLFGWLAFGHAMPIHGRLKSTFPIPNPQLSQVVGTIFSLGGIYRYKPLGALLAMLAGVTLLALAPRERAALRSAGFACAALCAAQLASFLLFQRWAKPIPPWYWGLPLLGAGLSLTIGAACHLAERSALRLAALAAAAALLTNVVVTGRVLTQLRAVTEAQAKEPGEELVAFMRSLPDDAIFAATDCGNMAFWSDRRVVNLDGLVNDDAYQRVLRDGALTPYLRERARYLTIGVWDRPDVQRKVEPMYANSIAPDAVDGRYEHVSFQGYSYLYGVNSEPIALPRTAEVFRSSTWKRGAVVLRYLVFDLQQVP
jgi:hypothetical protein